MALPAEVRNNIAELALVQDRIYLPQANGATDDLIKIFHVDLEHKPLHNLVLFHMQKAVGHTFIILVRIVLKFMSREAKSKRPTGLGVGLLAASRRTYEDSHWFYWALNTFYLPRGPASHARYYWASVNPRHKTLVMSVGIQFSLADLTPEILDHIAHYAHLRSDHNSPGQPLSGDVGSVPWRDYAVDALTHIWAQKLNYIRGWQNLHELKLEAPDQQQLLLRGRDLNSTLRGFDQPIYRIPFPGSEYDEPPHCDAEIWHFLKQAAAAVAIESSAIISNQGWEGFRVSVDQKLKGECCVLEQGARDVITPR